MPKRRYHTSWGFTSPRYKGRGVGARFKTPRRVNRRLFVPGWDRRGGFYGRYSGTNPEQKFVDTGIEKGTITTAMIIDGLCLIPEGNGESERVGRKVTVKSIHVTGTITLKPSTVAASSSASVICMLVQDKQTNGNAFTALDLVETDTHDTFRNLANSSRFKVLAKKIFNFSAHGGAPTGAAFAFGEVIRRVTFNKNVNIPIEYDNSATTGATTTIRSNNIYWVTQASSSLCESDLVARLRYADT